MQEKINSKDLFLHLPTNKIYECMGDEEGYVWHEGEETELQKFDSGDCEKIPEIFEPAILLLKKEIQDWKNIAESNAHANNLACETVWELQKEKSSNKS